VLLMMAILTGVRWNLSVITSSFQAGEWLLVDFSAIHVSEALVTRASVSS
jgi:hypothetical protein